MSKGKREVHCVAAEVVVGWRGSLGGSELRLGAGQSILPTSIFAAFLEGRVISAFRHKDNLIQQGEMRKVDSRA